MSAWFAAARAALRPAAWAALLLFVPQTVAQDGPGRVPAGLYDQGLGRGDPVLRQVGATTIRASDVYRLLDLANPGAVADAVEELTLMALVGEEALREGIDVPADDLEKASAATLAEQRARFAVEVSAELTLEEFVAARHGWTAAQFHEHLRQGVLGNLLLDRVVRLHMWRTPRDELQLILVSDEALAREIGDKLAAGASFDVLARAHSEHPSAEDAGVMPPLPASLQVPLVAGRETLSLGEIMGPDPIDLGGQTTWRIVRLLDRRPADERPWTVLRDELEADLAAEPLHPDELGLFEAAMSARYGGSIPGVETTGDDPAGTPP